MDYKRSKDGVNVLSIRPGDEVNFDGMPTHILSGLFVSAAGQYLLIVNNVMLAGPPCRELNLCPTTMAVGSLHNEISKMLILSMRELEKRSKTEGVPIEGFRNLMDQCKEAGYLDFEEAILKSKEDSGKKIEEQEIEEGKDEINPKTWKFGGFH